MIESTPTPAWKLLLGNHKFSMQSDNQEQLVKLISLTAVGILSFFSIFHWFVDLQSLAYLQLTTVLIFLPVIYSCTHGYRILSRPNIENIILSAALINFHALIIFNSYHNTGIYWVPIFPFLAFFIVGLHKGWFWLVAFSIIGIITTSIHNMVYTNPPYSLQELSIFILTFLFYTLVAAIFEGLREHQHLALHQTNKKLIEARKVILENNQTLKRQAQERADALIREIKEHKKTNQFLKTKEEQFNHAQKMETIGTLVGGIAHDFNNMLSGITVNAFMIKKAYKNDANIQERIGDIEHLVFYAADIIKQLLTFSRKDKPVFQNLNLTSFISEAYKLSELSVPENIQFQCTLPQEKLYIHGNPTLLQQVIMNLINNARDALVETAKPSIHLILEHIHNDNAFRRTYSDTMDTDYVQLSIIDNGTGINKEVMKHVFDPFFTTKQVGKGTGLGLAMCYGAIQSHQGFIDVQSSTETGSQFSIYIPLQEKKGTEHAYRQTYSDQEQGKGECILLVDDNEALRQSNTAALQTLGYKTLEACNGSEAINTFKKHQADVQLILMDIMMPIMGGYEAAKHIHDLQMDMPIIFITGYDKNTPLDCDDALQRGVITLNKPFTVEELNQVIQHTLSTKKEGQVL
ncbi:MAG: response regulator [Mariprofundaceae bacterium]|nr:response regulator [Mariprofundaceae bacterium]